jgi:hypothetical protein
MPHDSSHITIIDAEILYCVLSARRWLVFLVPCDLAQVSGPEITIVGEHQLKLVLTIDSNTNRLS